MKSRRAAAEVRIWVARLVNSVKVATGPTAVAAIELRRTARLPPGLFEIEVEALVPGCVEHRAIGGDLGDRIDAMDLVGSEHPTGEKLREDDVRGILIDQTFDDIRRPMTILAAQRKVVLFGAEPKIGRTLLAAVAQEAHVFRRHAEGIERDLQIIRDAIGDDGLDIVNVVPADRVVDQDPGVSPGGVEGLLIGRCAAQDFILDPPTPNRDGDSERDVFSDLLDPVGIDDPA